MGPPVNSEAPALCRAHPEFSTGVINSVVVMEKRRTPISFLTTLHYAARGRTNGKKDRA
jgi:hypothetical protein